ncbi:MAG: Holliday junction branch migration protein RuvA [Pseudomonadota bacterium]|jgi:Holliday junction DNA helicase RuvA
MIAYLEGKLLKKEPDRIVLLTQQIGYEIFVPGVVRENLADKRIGDDIALYIYHHQTERQPKPILIGFNREIERDFFRDFITVEDIGPLKAAKALTVSVRQLARAIEEHDLGALKKLKGIGPRTAKKILATLEGKMGKFALIREPGRTEPKPIEDFVQQVQKVLVNQLGHRQSEAKKMISEALKRKTEISSAEELFEEVYRGETSK